ncbi:MAG: fluoride efflux transporter CrcB [Fimbriimonadaceae bacterium]|nr:fluoride efflux transporter CrcB [Fimbriimonadaceae bacterium]
MDTALKFVLVFVGGGVGSCARFAIGELVRSRVSGEFPWGTFSVNVTGALVIGILMGALFESGTDSTWRLLLAVGTLGGYTTFSALAYESLKMLENRNYGVLAAYMIGTNVLGLAACWLGLVIARRALGH